MEQLFSGDLFNQFMPIILMGMATAMGFFWGKVKSITAASENKIDDEVVRLIEQTVTNAVNKTNLP